VSLPHPTGWGIKSCRQWPRFSLQDYNPDSKSKYLEFYGLNEATTADVTIVGMYFADLKESQEEIVLHEKLKTEIEKKHKDIKVNAVALNYYAPYGCALSECVNSVSWPDWWWSDKCMNYIGGCAPGTFVCFLFSCLS
jgi:hypothetical protein